MSTITTEQVKELRDATGVSVMQCKKALEEAGGDMEKALLILKKKSTEIAAKKSDREAAAGTVAYAGKTGTGVLLALRCETDFVAKNSDFTTIAQTLAQTALEGGKKQLKLQHLSSSQAQSRSSVKTYSSAKLQSFLLLLSAHMCTMVVSAYLSDSKEVQTSSQRM